MAEFLRTRRPAAVAMAIALCVPAAALSQEVPLSLVLTCHGTDVGIEQTGSITTVTVTPGVPAPAFTPKQHQDAVARMSATTSSTTKPTYAEVRAPAHLSLAIQGDVVRLRPSENTDPGLLSRKRSSDGWYDLTEVAISETQIRGKTAWGGVLSGKYRLQLDRITGDAKFGSFRGVCEKAAADPKARKF